MMTTEQLLDVMEHLPEKELERLKLRLEKLIREKKPRPAMRGEKLMALAGSVNTGKVLEPFPTREQLYDETW